MEPVEPWEGTGPHPGGSTEPAEYAEGELAERRETAEAKDAWLQESAVRELTNLVPQGSGAEGAKGASSEGRAGRGEVMSLG